MPTFFGRDPLGEPGIISPLAGEDDSDPALNGWNVTEGLRGKDEGSATSCFNEDLELVACGKADDGRIEEPPISSSSAFGIRVHGLYLESCDSSPEALSDVRVEETAVLGANLSDSNRSAVTSSKLQSLRYLTDTFSKPSTQGSAAK